MAPCRDCKFWVGPPAMEPDKEAIALSRGVNRQGGCHRSPLTIKTDADHWCGEHRAAPKLVPEVS